MSLCTGYFIKTGSVSKKCVGLLAFVLVIWCALVPRSIGDAVPPESPHKSLGVLPGLQSLLSGLFEDLHKFVVSIVGTKVIETTAENAKLNLDSVFGQEKVQTVLEFIQMTIKFLSEGVASGLNVIAVFVTEILRATGITVELPFPHFTPEGVASVAQWALLALLGYWVLSLVMRLAMSLLRRVLWLLKLGVALWLFLLIVRDTDASTDTTAIRLAALVCACVVMGVGCTRSGEEKSKQLEGRLKGLEGRLKAIERREKED